VLVMSGFNIRHVWRGSFDGATGSATWSDVSGGPGGSLPDIPVNALTIDPVAPDTWFIGTDIGVFRTDDAGAHLAPVSNGRPTCAASALTLHPARVLRAATHGRGLWEYALAQPTTGADLAVRAHPLAAGRRPLPAAVSAAFAAADHVSRGASLEPWMSPDI